MCFVANCTTDLEYWKCPSRRLYVSKQAQFDDASKDRESGKGKRRAKKRKSADDDLLYEEDDSIHKVIPEVSDHLYSRQFGVLYIDVLYSQTYV